MTGGRWLVADDGAWCGGGGSGPAGGQDQETGPWRSRLAVVAGSTTALVAASLTGSALGFLNRVGMPLWGLEHLPQAVPGALLHRTSTRLYFGEGLSSGKVPYTGHPVEYPVLIERGQCSWSPGPVRPIADPFTRGREFFDVTVLLLAIFAVAGVLATAYLAGRSRRWTALGVALAPGLVLASFINWDLIAMGLVALGMAAWAARRGVLAGVLLGLAVATSSPRAMRPAPSRCHAERRIRPARRHSSSSGPKNRSG